MKPKEQFCPNMECSARGKEGEGNIVVHSQKEKRCRCTVCGKTFSVRKGTALYGVKKSEETFVKVVTLLAHGCPVKAIEKAFGLDDKTVRAWLKKAGMHCEEIHQHFMEKENRDLGQVQADEIKAKTQGGSVWIAMAMMVSTRLWLGGIVGVSRDKSLVRALADQVRQWALCRPILIAVDGFRPYLKAFRAALRSPYKGDQGGRPRLYVWEEVAIVQVIKRCVNGTLSVERRIAQGCTQLVERLIQASQKHGGINTSYIERLNATFRQRLACLVRRGRALARQVETLHYGMFLVGEIYNFCTPHHSLRIGLWLSEHRIHWVPITPAVAASLTDHCWSVEELLAFKLPIAPFVPPKRRGRPPKMALLGALS